MSDYNIYCEGNLVIIKDDNDQEYKGGMFFFDSSNKLYASLYLNYDSNNYDSLYLYCADPQVNGLSVLATNPAIGDLGITCAMTNVGLWSLGVTTYAVDPDYTAISADHFVGPNNPGDTVCVINSTGSGFDNDNWGLIMNTLGQSISACNYGYFGFNFQELGSPLNELVIGYCDEYGDRQVAQQIDMAGNITFGGGLLYLNYVDSYVGVNKNPSYALDVSGTVSATKYKVGSADVLTSTTLGSSVTTSSLTSVGTLTNLTVAGDLAVDTNTLKVDSTNNRVGVVNSTPAYPLDVTGDVNSTTTYKVGGVDVLSSTTLGSGVVNSSLTSVGTLSSLTVTGNVSIDSNTLKVDSTNNRVGIVQTTPAYPLDVTGDVNTSTKYKIGGADVLTSTTLGSTVTASSLTSVGTLTGLTSTGVNILGTANQPSVQIFGDTRISRGAWADPQAGTAYALKCSGEAAFDRVNVKTGFSYQINRTDVLTATTLGSGVVNSSLTSLGTLNSLTVSGDVTIDSNTLKVDSTNNRIGIKNLSPAYTLDVNGDTNIVGKLTVSGGISGVTPYDLYTRTTTLSLPTVAEYAVTFDQANNATSGLTYSAGRFTNSTGRPRLIQLAFRGNATHASSSFFVYAQIYVNGVRYGSGSIGGTASSNPFLIFRGIDLFVLRDSDYFELNMSPTVASVTIDTGLELMIVASG